MSDKKAQDDPQKKGREVSFPRSGGERERISAIPFASFSNLFPRAFDRPLEMATIFSSSLLCSRHPFPSSLNFKSPANSARGKPRSLAPSESHGKRFQPRKFEIFVLWKFSLHKIVDFLHIGFESAFVQQLWKMLSPWKMKSPWKENTLVLKER